MLINLKVTGTFSLVFWTQVPRTDVFIRMKIENKYVTECYVISVNVFYFLQAV